MPRVSGGGSQALEQTAQTAPGRSPTWRRSPATRAPTRRCSRSTRRCSRAVADVVRCAGQRVPAVARRKNPA